MPIIIALIIIALVHVVIDFFSGTMTIGSEVIHDKSIHLVRQAFDSPHTCVFTSNSKSVHLFGKSELKARFVTSWGIIYSFYIKTDYGYYNVIRFSKMHYFIKSQIRQLKKNNPKTQPTF